jgi:hypothetical protein
MLFGNCDSHKSMHELFPINNYSKEDNACAIFHHNVQICGAPPTWADPLHCVQSCFQLKTLCQRQMCMVFLMYFLIFFNPVAFKMSPWIPRSIWSIQVINHLFGVLIHRWFHDIQCQYMLPPVIAFFVVGAAFSVCPSHQPWQYKQCRRTYWLMWFFSPWHLPGERIHVLPNIHKDMHI